MRFLPRLRSPVDIAATQGAIDPAQIGNRGEEAIDDRDGGHELLSAYRTELQLDASDVWLLWAMQRLGERERAPPKDLSGRFRGWVESDALAAGSGFPGDMLEPRLRRLVKLGCLEVQPEADRNPLGVPSRYRLIGVDHMPETWAEILGPDGMPPTRAQALLPEKPCGLATPEVVGYQQEPRLAPLIEDPVSAFAGQRLTLRYPGSGDPYVLRSSAGQTLGLLASRGYPAPVVAPFGYPAEVFTAEGLWQLSIVRRRVGWRAEAQASQGGEPVARYAPSGLLGGRVWVAPVHRYSLRPAPWTGNWSLRAVRRRPAARLATLKGNLGGFEIDILESGDDPNLSLLILFTSWVVMVEQSAAEDGGWGGVGGV